MAKRHGMTFGIAKIGQWDRDQHNSVLFIEDRDGRTWGVRATREGDWNVHKHPNAYDDDERVYASGNVRDTGAFGGETEFSSSAEAFKAAKKTARKYLVDLLESENLL